MLFRSKLRKKSVRKIALPNFNRILPLKQKLCDENKDHGWKAEGFFVPEMLDLKKIHEHIF